MRHNIYDEENLDLQEDENTEIYIGPVVSEEGEEEVEEKIVEVAESDYRVTAISESFLRTELDIICESNRTKVKFAYKGGVYTGVVLHKLNKADYVFLVQDATVRNAEKKMKKIHIPDASIIL